MAVQVRWLKRALDSLSHEVETIAKDNPQAAASLVMRIEEAVVLLADHPELGRAGRVPGTREFVVAGTPYIVPYRVCGGNVDILRVFHGRRKWPEQF